MSKDPQTAPAPAAPAKKSRRGFVIVLVVVVLLLAGGGGGAYWVLFRGADAEAAENVAPPAPPPTGIIPLDPFVVNLADTTGSRFLRVMLSLVVADERQAKELEKNKIAHMRVRSAILETLAQRQASELVTPEGKAQLKKSIAAGVVHAAPGLEVADVLFSEFIVQF